MNMRIGLLFFLVTLISATTMITSPVVYADTKLGLPSQQLPSQLPKGNTTPAKLLGTNEEGIGLKKGQRVPQFNIQDHEGQPRDLNSLINDAPLLVIFYRGGWCPYCNLQIRQLSMDFSKFKSRGITPVLISVDSPNNATLALKAYDIPFPVLSDPDLKAHKAFEVILDIDEKTYQRYQTYGIELEDWSNKKHHKIAVTSVFILDDLGVVQWAHTSKDYKARPSTNQLLSVIDHWHTEVNAKN